MMENILVYGASGHGKVIADLLEKAGHKILGFLDDDPEKTGKRLLGYAVLGDRSVLKSLRKNDIRLLIAIGDSRERKAVADDLQNQGFRFGLAVHPSAQIGKSAELGEGTVIMAGAVVNCDTKIGRHVIINTSASIDHDCRIGDFVHISPGACLGGGVEVGEGSWIGLGASVINQGRIGKHALVGMGAVVIRPVKDNSVVVGNPARILKTKP